MFGFPASTEFDKRIPKQKFYEKLDIDPATKRSFVEKIRGIYWRNKLAATTLNLAKGDTVTEVEVFEVRLHEPKLDEAVLRQIDREIPYHILFILTAADKTQLSAHGIELLGHRSADAAGSPSDENAHYFS